jgi:hypothetical protein
LAIEVNPDSAFDQNRFVVVPAAIVMQRIGNIVAIKVRSGGKDISVDVHL